MKLTTEEMQRYRLFDSPSKRSLDTIRLDYRASKEHNRLLIQECEKLFNQNHRFLTTARLVGNMFKGQVKIADIVDLTFGSITEIGVTESDESLWRKGVFWRKLGFDYFVVRSRVI